MQLKRRLLRGAVLVALASATLAAGAYFWGLWPQRLAVTVEGPAGWRLTRIDDLEVDEPLPAHVSKYLGLRPDGSEVTCRLEVATGAAQARCRVRAWNIGCFKTGHQALPCSVESLDGSLWLMSDRGVAVHPRAPGQSWFGCDSWGRCELQVDGVVSDNAIAHAHTTPADDAWHDVQGRGWSLSYLADAGTAVHLSEWGSPDETIVRCDDAGFASGTFAIDGAQRQALALDRPVKVEGRKIELGLESSDCSMARVRLERQSSLQLTLRVSR